jgi:hypothetical protein
MNEDAICPKYYDWRNSVPNNLNAWPLRTVHNINMGHFVPHKYIRSVDDICTVDFDNIFLIVQKLL